MRLGRSEQRFSVECLMLLGITNVSGKCGKEQPVHCVTDFLEKGNRFGVFKGETRGQEQDQVSFIGLGSYLEFL